MKAVLTHDEGIVIIRAAVLFPRFGAVLTEAGRDAVEEVTARFKKKGREARVSGDELRLVREAATAMQAIRDRGELV